MSSVVQRTASPVMMLDPMIGTRLAAARAGDQQEFGGLTEPYRRELQLHCYRILGSLQDAEDIVQETMLRAWRKLHTFQERASLRAWLYKIATNACFDALDKRPRRVLPMSVYPAADPHALIDSPVTEPIWLEPYPDDLIAEPETGPEARYAAHESVTLAFIAALQSLPPRQRVVLILRDVLDWQANEVAELLDLTVSAVNSALHRARVTLSKRHEQHGREAIDSIALEDALRPLLERYVQVWESADVDGLIALLKEDATFSMPPIPTWYRGRVAIAEAVRPMIFASGSPGRWRLRSIRANAQPAFAIYQRTESGGYHLFGLQVLTFNRQQITDVTTFTDPELTAGFKLPVEIET